MESLKYHPEEGDSFSENQSTAPPSKSKDEDVKQEELPLEDLDMKS